ncbi:MAG: hypothetical protein KBC32_11680 [Candidatus Didemnitutus sp.]|nr:hypothetical protein [Candidatus Didemnitutus sp.]
MKTHLQTPNAHRGGFLAKVLLVLALLAVVAAIVWVLLLPRIVATTIRSKTGFAVKIDRLSVNPFTAKVQLGGFVMQNPEGWPEATPFVELREFRADADLFPLLGGKLMADEVVVDVAQVTLVKNKDGVLNAIAFKDGLTGPASQEPAPKEKSGAKTEFLIKRMVVKFDKLTYADHSGRKPSVKEYNLGINRELTNVDSVADLVSPFSGAAFGVVTDAVGGMVAGGKDALIGAGKLLQDGGAKAGETLKGFMQSLDKKKP